MPYIKVIVYLHNECIIKFILEVFNLNVILNCINNCCYKLNISINRHL